jgi:succinyl-diaminopimelate desuccinylase
VNAAEGRRPPSLDLLAATAALVDIPSVSHDEEAITGHLEDRLRAVPWLEVTRIGRNLVARTDLGRSQRLVLAGHTDTVPVNDNAGARIDGDVLHGLGSADMKGGLAVFLALAEQVPEPTCDVTYVFYECEEVAAVHNGLRRLLGERPDLLACDAAVLGEPTTSIIEAGCQGTLRAQLTLRGARAHTARPWMGRNAIHRLATVLDRLHTYEERRPVLDGCEYREAIQAVKVEGGVAGNVVPDAVTLTINHRFAPDRSVDDAVAHVRDVIGTDVLADDAEFTLVDAANAAAPSLRQPLLAGLADRVGAPPRAKLGWTDVAFFAAQGIPAVNFGPGDPTIAHTKGEHVHRHEIERAFDVLCDLLTS